MTISIVKPSWVIHPDETRTDNRPTTIYTLSLHPDQSRLATGGLDTKIRLWSTLSIRKEQVEKDKKVPKLLSTLISHSGVVMCLRWSNDGRYLASGSDDKIVMIWCLEQGKGGKVWGLNEVNVENWKAVRRLVGHDSDVAGVAWSPHDEYVASVGLDSTAYVYSGRNFERIARLDGHMGFVKGVVFDPVGQYLATQSDDGSAKIWRTSDWKLHTTIEEVFVQAPKTNINRLSWSPDGSHLVLPNATSNEVFVAALIDRNNFRGNTFLVGHGNIIECCAFNPHLFKRDLHKSTTDPTNFCSLLAISARNTLSLWITSKTEPIIVFDEVFQRDILDLSWSKDGKQLWACSSEGHVALFEFEDLEIEVAQFVPIGVKEKFWQEMYGVVGRPVTKSQLLLPPVIAAAVAKTSLNGFNGVVGGGNTEMIMGPQSIGGSTLTSTSTTMNGGGVNTLVARKGPGAKRIVPKQLHPLPPQQQRPQLLPQQQQLHHPSIPNLMTGGTEGFGGHPITNPSTTSGFMNNQLQRQGFTSNGGLNPQAPLNQTYNNGHHSNQQQETLTILQLLQQQSQTVQQQLGMLQQHQLELQRQQFELQGRIPAAVTTTSSSLIGSSSSKTSIHRDVDMTDGGSIQRNDGNGVGEFIQELKELRPTFAAVVDQRSFKGFSLRNQSDQRRQQRRRLAKDDHKGEGKGVEKDAEEEEEEEEEEEDQDMQLAIPAIVSHGTIQLEAPKHHSKEHGLFHLEYKNHPQGLSTGEGKGIYSECSCVNINSLGQTEHVTTTQWIDYLPSLIVSTAGSLNFSVVSLEDGSLIFYSPKGRKTWSTIILDSPCSFLNVREEFCLSLTAKGTLKVYDYLQKKVIVSTNSIREHLLLHDFSGGRRTSGKEDEVKKKESIIITTAGLLDHGIPILALSNGITCVWDLGLKNWVKVGEPFWIEQSQIPRMEEKGRVEELERSIRDVLEDEEKGHVARENEISNKRKSNEPSPPRKRSKTVDTTIATTTSSSSSTTTPNHVTSNHIDDGSKYLSVINLCHLENRLKSSIILNSKEEYQKSLISYCEKLAQEGLVGKAEELIEELLGPIYWLSSKPYLQKFLWIDDGKVFPTNSYHFSSCSQLPSTNQPEWDPKIVGFSKRDILDKVVLTIFEKNESTRRLAEGYRVVLKKILRE